MSHNLYTEFAACCFNHKDEKICGDNYVVKQFASRTIAVLSDGMGHGMKANILSTLTSSMLSNFTSARIKPPRIAAMLAAILPVNEITGNSYATFTLADIDHCSGEALLMQYDNPKTILLRKGNAVALAWSEPYTVEGRPGKLITTSFRVAAGDRLVMLTDGVTQSGQATGIYRFGWGEGDVVQYCSYLAADNPSITSSDFARLVVSKSRANDKGSPRDDMSCAVLTIRHPRRMQLVSCPPALISDSQAMARDVVSFEGDKVICGQPVASMIAAYTGETLQHDESHWNGSDYPVYSLRGFDIVTDGVIVPARILDILEHHTGDGENIKGGDIPSKISRMLLRNDLLSFKIGMRRNIDPRGFIPDEFSIRRNILRRIISLLEKKYGKTVETKFF